MQQQQRIGRSGPGVVRRRLCLATLALATTQAQAGLRVVDPSGDSPGSVPTLREALRLARDGELILLAPGRYAGDGGVVRQRGLTIRAAGGEAVFDAQGQRLTQDKAVLVAAGDALTLEGLAFEHALAPDANGAGVRLERGSLRVHRCRFEHNQMGLLTSNDARARLQVEDCVFARAAPPRGRGLHHLLYVGAIGEARVSGCRFQQGGPGHLLKCRARQAWVAYNLFDDGPMGSASYELEFPNGGDVTLIGNLVHQGAGSPNPSIVAFGAEGGERRERHRLRMSHNTLINAQLTPAAFVRVWEEKLGTPLQGALFNNLLIGVGALLGAPAQQGTRRGPSGLLRDPVTGDYRLVERALLPVGVDATTDADLRPQREFAWPLGTRALTPPTAWRAGALQ